MRPRVVDAADWRLELRDAQGRSASLGAAALADLPLTQRDAVLACVHNRPGWDRLGQQRWTGLPIPDLLSAAGLSVPADDADLDLVMTGADGLVMVLPWREAVARGSWLVTGMDGRPLTAAHGHPARVMTPGLVGQYNGVKWASSLHLAPAGSVRATWVAKGWPVGPVTVPPSARIDSPGRVGMPPRLPVGRVRVPARCEVRGTAWAPAHGGVAGVEVSVSGGPWRPADLEPDHGPASWRPWPPYPQGADGFHRVRVRVG